MKRINVCEGEELPYCPNCGGQINEGYDRCKRCGFNITQIKGLLNSSQEAVKSVVLQRIEGIKRKDAEAVQRLINKENYTKFDDWPPFERQGLDGLKREAEALKVLKEYRYEVKDLRIDLFDNVALTSFIIKYSGRIRNMDFDVRSRVTIVLVKAGDEWKIVHEHWSRFPERESWRHGLFFH
ncbi:MAG: nuclear transport factor 2 family protein [Candidatus Bathyarchaeota archaeon]|nr:nuclear transport factor 2 family protein [Candidatus Bathyarchaeota archaeon]